MNWGRVKTIFIVLFLICDLFLLGTLVVSNHRQSIISPEIIDATVSLLGANNISIDPSLITNSSKDMPFLEAENIITGYDEFAKILLGTGITKTGEYSYTGDAGTVSFSGDSFNLNTTIVLAKDEKTAEKNTSQFLKELGFDLSAARINTKSENGTFSVTYSGHTDGFPVFASKVTMTFSADGTANLSGTWFNPIDARGENYPIKSIPSMLIDMVPSLPSSGTEISALDFGYIVPEENTYHKSAVLLPTLRILTRTGDSYFADARNPE